MMSGRGTDILLGGSPKGLTLSVIEYVLGHGMLEGTHSRFFQNPNAPRVTGVLFYLMQIILFNI